MTLQVIRIDKLPSRAARPKAAPAIAATTSRYTPRRTVRTTRSVSSLVKIKRVAKLFVLTICVFTLIFGMFWLINKLLFPKDREASGEYDITTTTTEPSYVETNDENGVTDETSQTEPDETTEPTNQGSTSTTAPSTQPGYTTYTVKSGDTLMSIARQFYNDASKYVLIQEANNLEDPDHIVVGQRLIIPEID